MKRKCQNFLNIETVKTLFYSTKDFEQPFLEAAGGRHKDVSFIREALSIQTVNKAKGFDVISIFAGDDASSNVIAELYQTGVRFIAIRAAGYDNVDIKKARELGIAVANAPAYSPYAIAEHAVTLMLALNRKITTADNQVHHQNFTVSNLVGFDLNRKIVGIIGVGKIGSILVKIMHGFGCRLLGYDVRQNKELNEEYKLEYVDLGALCREADIISIHTSLTPHTKYMLNSKLVNLMKRGVMIINTSRGGCVNTADIIAGLENGHIGYYGADVYENERGVFFYDYSDKEIRDPMLKKLLSLPNVLLTPHQAFATQEALFNIAEATFDHIDCWENGQDSENELTRASYEIALQHQQLCNTTKN